MRCNKCGKQPDGCIECERKAQTGAINKPMIRLIDLVTINDKATLEFLVGKLKEAGTVIP